MMEQITSRDNPKVRQVIKLQTNRRAREKEGLFCCEGEKLLREALSSGIQVEQVFLSEDLPQAEALELGPKTYRVPRRLMEQMSGVESPQGVLFVCRRPQLAASSPQGCCLVLEDVRDPGNVGTVVRTAEALGVPVLLTGSCADLYQPKTIRATMGSIFRADVRQVERDALWAQWAEQGTAAYAAALTLQAKDIRQVDLRQAAVVVGNEAQGVSPAMQQHCGGQVIIPIQGAESLNASVAAALVMWEMKRGS